MKMKASEKVYKVTTMKKNAKIDNFAQIWHLCEGLSDQPTDQPMDKELLMDVRGLT